MTKKLSFSDLLEKGSNQAYTANGALSHASTLDRVLDLFSRGGSMRNSAEREKVSLIRSALSSDVLTAFKAIFYIGDIRGGAGERDMFLTALKVLADEHSEKLSAIVDLIPFYSRWDYVYALVGTKAEESVKELIRKEYATVLETGEPSLMFKWLKSTNASSKETNRLGRWTAKVLGFENDYKGIHAYQKMLSTQRAKLTNAVVERLMSAGRFEDIDYSKIPAQAGLRYKTAFYKRDEVRYAAFVEAVARGEKKVNAGTLNPHDIVGRYGSFYGRKLDQVLENAWKALPNYIKNGENVITVCDTSGSMSTGAGKGSVTVRDVANALSIYCAERLTGVFANKVISFSSKAKFFDLGTGSLMSKINVLERNSIVDSTNIQSVFDLILSTAISHHIPVEELPTKVIIISDMQFDAGCYDNNSTNLEVIRAKYAQAGYPMPQLVYWNVNSYGDSPATKYDKGVAMISGFATTIIGDILEGEILDPVRSMLKVLNGPRYMPIEEKLK